VLTGESTQYFYRFKFHLSNSYSLTVFSPSGKLVQIEHALAAVSQGTTSLGIKGEPAFYNNNHDQTHSIQATNGIVIATEKKSSSILIDPSMLDKVSVVCPNIGLVYSGMGPDFRVLVNKARKSAQAYWKIHGEYPPTRVLTQEIATVMQQATQSGLVPPPTHEKSSNRDTSEVYDRMGCRYSWQVGMQIVDRVCTKLTPLAHSGPGKPAQ
jgi:Proteasome subunit/Proteasome subunit A N-terminal signature